MGWILTMVLAALVLAGVAGLGRLSQVAGTWRDQRRYPAPGERIQVGPGRRLHVRKRGIRGPVVLLESGLAASSISWHFVVGLLEGEARVWVYDRAGLAWSDAPPEPFGLDEMLADLGAVVDHVAAGEKVVLAGHSLGGVLGRIYASRYPDRVRALVMVDPPALSDWAEPGPGNAHRRDVGIHLSMRGRTLAWWGVVRLALLLTHPGVITVGRWFAKALAGKGHAVAARMVAEIKKLPPRDWDVIRSHWCQEKGFVSMACHLRALTPACRMARESQLPEIPVAVVSASKASAAEKADHQGIAARPLGRLFETARSGHWPQLDEPEVVAAAIRWPLGAS